MSITSRQILKTYVTLTLLSTFAASLIWGINTLFLLDAGLSVTRAFAANAFFTAGQVVFEVPTGVVADTLGRRMSYLAGSASSWWPWSRPGCRRAGRSGSSRWRPCATSSAPDSRCQIAEDRRRPSHAFSRAGAGAEVDT